MSHHHHHHHTPPAGPPPTEDEGWLAHPPAASAWKSAKSPAVPSGFGQAAAASPAPVHHPFTSRIHVSPHNHDAAAALPAPAPRSFAARSAVHYDNTIQEFRNRGGGAGRMPLQVASRAVPGLDPMKLRSHEAYIRDRVRLLEARLLEEIGPAFAPPSDDYYGFANPHGAHAGGSSSRGIIHHHAGRTPDLQQQWGIDLKARTLFLQQRLEELQRMQGIFELEGHGMRSSPHPPPAPPLSAQEEMERRYKEAFEMKLEQEKATQMINDERRKTDEENAARLIGKHAKGTLARARTKTMREEKAKKLEREIAMEQARHQLEQERLHHARKEEEKLHRQHEEEKLHRQKNLELERRMEEMSQRELELRLEERRLEERRLQDKEYEDFVNERRHVGFSEAEIESDARMIRGQQGEAAIWNHNSGGTAFVKVEAASMLTDRKRRQDTARSNHIPLALPLDGPDEDYLRGRIEDAWADVLAIRQKVARRQSEVAKLRQQQVLLSNLNHCRECETGVLGLQVVLYTLHRIGKAVLVGTSAKQLRADNLLKTMQEALKACSDELPDSIDFLGGSCKNLLMVREQAQEMSDYLLIPR